MPFEVSKEDFFTPRTFGMLGTTVKGFDVDHIYKPGANMSSTLYNPVQVSSPTWVILRFHLLNSMLRFVLGVITIYKGLPGYLKRVISMRVAAVEFDRFEDMTKGTVPGLLQSKESITRKLPDLTVPKNMAVVLKYHSRVAPPQPEFPQSKFMPDGTFTEPSDDEIGRVLDVIDTDYKEKEEHEKKETDRLIHEVTDLVTWSVVAGVPILTIYEQCGFVAKLDRDRLIASTRDKLALGYGVTDANIRIHVRSTKTTHEFDNNNTVTQPAAPSPAVIPQTETKSPRLEVILLRESDAEYAVKKAMKKMAKNMGEKNEPDFTSDGLRQTIFQAMSSTSVRPDLLMLLSSQASTDGFPAYVLQDAMIYRDFTHKAQADVKLFYRALKAYSNQFTESTTV